MNYEHLKRDNPSLNTLWQVTIFGKGIYFPIFVTGFTDGVWLIARIRGRLRDMYWIEDETMRRTTFYEDDEMEWFEPIASIEAVEVTPTFTSEIPDMDSEDDDAIGTR